MFRRLKGDAALSATLFFEGQPVAIGDGDSVAAALLAAGIVSFRQTPVLDSPRGPFCLMGACFDCLMEIDGQPDRQACQVDALDGTVVRRQIGAGNHDH